MAVAELSDHEALHAALEPFHRVRRFARVLSLTENGLLPAAVVGDRLGVPGNPSRAVRLLKDKRRMRDLLNARGLSPVRARPVSSSADLAAFLGEVDGPVVLKPATGAGSHAVLRVDLPGEAEDAWRRFTDEGGGDPVAEEYLAGPEISVECFSHEGRHVAVTTTDKHLLGNLVEAGHTVPSSLAAEEVDRAVNLVRDFLDLVGLREGPSHTELRITVAGPRIIESHNRIGGDKIRELVRRAHGVDLVRLTVGAALGLLPPLTEPPPAHGGAAVRFLTPAPGLVRSVELPRFEDSRTTVSVDVGPGDRVKSVRRSEDRSGYVLAEGADAAEAARVCERAAALVRIGTVPDRAEEAEPCAMPS
ncbi:argininosuccinate lyase [Nocardiopsis terrae]|nr:argininosuccinate lyase [Nocardiopsis terrae]